MTRTAGYSAPTIVDLGSLHDLTLTPSGPLTPKDSTGRDGFVFNSIVLGPVSV